MGKINHIGRDTQTFQGVTHSLLGVMHTLWGGGGLYSIRVTDTIGVTHIL
jgi:hypothetical protein